MDTTRSASGLVIGFLVGDPKTQGATQPTAFTEMVYDARLGDMVEREGVRPASEHRTFSISVQQKGMDRPHLVQCVDYHNLSKLCRDGDKVAIRGYLETRTHSDDQIPAPKQLVVEELTILKAA